MFGNKFLSRKVKLGNSNTAIRALCDRVRDKTHLAIFTMQFIRGPAVTDTLAVTVDSPASFLIVQKDPKTILKIDFAFRNVLENFNISVAKNESGLETVMKNGNDIGIDLVVLDAQFEDLGPIRSLVIMIRNYSNFEHVPIVILSDKIEEDLEKTAKSYNALIVSPRDELVNMAPGILQTIMEYWMSSKKDLYIYKA